MKKLIEDFEDLDLPKFLKYEPTLTYNDLDVEVEDDWCDDYWDYSSEEPNQRCGTVNGVVSNWTYYASSDEMDAAVEKIFNKSIDDITQEEIDSLTEEKFMDTLYEICRPAAKKDAYENHDFDDVNEYEPDWDSMPGGHDYYEGLLREKKKKKPYSSITHTTGDIQKNIDHFNKVLSGKAPNTHLDGLPSIGLDSDGSSSLSTGGESSGVGDGGGMGESLNLNEEKRYVRRYYIRPQHIWCSNKKDVLKALIDIDKTGQNCSVYTLNNLTDNDDVTKLSNKDIIYTYDNGILYDKNHVKVMDYDLYIKHEEERDNLDPDKVSDATFKDVYDDRVTDLTVDEAFYLNFSDVNAYGERLVEGKEVDTECCICGEKINGYGNNPEPYMSAESGKCCDACNLHFVIPARLSQARSKEEDEE